MFKNFVYLLTLAGCATSAVYAEEAADPLQRCAEIDEGSRRLQCYDDAAMRDRSGSRPAPEEEIAQKSEIEAAEPAPRQPANRKPAAEAALTREDRFGLERTEEQVREPVPDELTATVANIGVRRHGERVFTLDNGQVWLEKSANRSLHLQVGDTVTIKPGLFGSHSLFGSGNRSSKVDRLR
jgi:hypothetical protein